MAELLNKDWLQYPWLRCCTSQLLAGLVEGTTAVIINTVEPYCRDTMLDAHHERRVFGGPTSFPSTPNRYGFLSISKLSTSDGPVVRALVTYLLLTAFVWHRLHQSPSRHTTTEHEIFQLNYPCLTLSKLVEQPQEKGVVARPGAIQEVAAVAVATCREVCHVKLRLSART